MGGAATAIGATGRAIAKGQTARHADLAELIARNGGSIDAAPFLDDGTEALIAAMSASELAKYLQSEEQDTAQR
jgi:glutamate-1-semialdehyde aminotransferase